MHVNKPSYCQVGLIRFCRWLYAQRVLEQKNREIHDLEYELARICKVCISLNKTFFLDFEKKNVKLVSCK